MKTIELEKTKGYEIGKNSGKTWVARITQDGRQFLTANEIDYGPSRDWFRKNRATRIDTFHLTNGLYEVCELGQRHFRLVFTKLDGTTGSMAIEDDRASRMIAILESGEDFETARSSTKAIA